MKIKFLNENSGLSTEVQVYLENQCSKVCSSSLRILKKPLKNPYSICENQILNKLKADEIFSSNDRAFKMALRNRTSGKVFFV